MEAGLSWSLALRDWWSSDQLIFKYLLIHFSDSQSGVPKPVASALPGSLLEMASFRPHPKETESETLGEGGPEIRFNKSLPGDADAG